MFQDSIKELLKPIVKDVYDFIKEEVRQVISNRILEYQVYLYDKCSRQKTLLHRTQAIHIDDFYVPLFLKEYHDYYTNRRRRSQFQRISTENVTKIFELNPNILIFGSAGCGKSTLVRHFVLSSIREEFKIPILIELRNLKKTEGDFDKYVVENIFEYQKLGVNEEATSRILYKGVFLFILDGFDEISDKLRESVTQSIRQFIQKYSANSFLITSRHYQPISSLENFKNFEICALDAIEVTGFIKKQFHDSDAQLAEQIISELEKTKNTVVKEYLKTPLLLSLFIINYLNRREFPFNKSEFYYGIFDSLFNRLDKLLKTDFVHEKISDLSKEDFLKVLSYFSILTWFSDRFEYSAKYFEETINKIKKVRDLKFNTSDLLTDLLLNINLLIEDGEVVKFPHRSLQEYFAAYFLTNLSVEQKPDIYKRVSEKKDLFVNELLLEIDYINALEFILIPTIKQFVSKHREAVSYILSAKDDHSVLFGELYFVYAHFDFENELRDLLDNHKVIQIKKSSGRTVRFDSETSWDVYSNANEVLLFVESSELLIDGIYGLIKELKKKDIGLIELIRKGN